MWSFFRHIWWGGDPDLLDSVTGLSRRDVHHIKKSWEQLYADPITNGMWLFVKLFRADPSIQDLFVTIKGLPEEEFTSTAQFKAHVLNFTSYLNMTVTALHQPDIVISLMQRLGKTHKRFRVKQEHFHILTQVLVDTLKVNLGASDDVIDSWSRLLSFLYKSLFETLTSTSNE